MARTKGSGWGAGVILYQKCPKCGKKKVMFDWCRDIPPFKCTACKERFHDDTLIRHKYISEVKK